MLQFLQNSLFPIAILYNLVTKLRNNLYDDQVFKSIKTPVFSICVGNLSVGGTGKTPHIEYLIRLLSSNYQIATLSRGYGRKTKGFIMADKTSNAEIVGDEPMQFFVKFGNKVSVVVGEKRVVAVEKLLKIAPKTQIILLDDAFQHRAIKANLNILLTDYQNLFYKDYLLPTGRLRENRKGAKRADIVIITKTSTDIQESDKQEIEKEIAQYTQINTPIFWSFIQYLPLKPLFESSESPKNPPNKNVILLTGLANSNSLKNYITENYNLLHHIELADHQNYTISLIKELLFEYQKNKNAIIITTEKDMVKLQNPIFYNLLKNINFYYLPISITFSDEDRIKFNNLIQTNVSLFV
jgi:tetraacyldisaccharide 4'-kinase